MFLHLSLMCFHALPHHSKIRWLPRIRWLSEIFHFIQLERIDWWLAIFLTFISSACVFSFYFFFIFIFVYFKQQIQLSLNSFEKILESPKIRSEWKIIMEHKMNSSTAQTQWSEIQKEQHFLTVGEIAITSRTSINPQKCITMLWCIVLRCDSHKTAIVRNLFQIADISVSCIFRLIVSIQFY